MLNKLYINKKTYEVFENAYELSDLSPEWVLVPEGSASAYYFDGTDPDGDDDDEVIFYNAKNEMYDNSDWYEIASYNLKYRNKWAKLLWERNPPEDSMESENTIIDVVNHPEHYTSDDCGVEAIEITSLLPCCISNALKYVWRCGKKDEDLQELKKAKWYLEYSISKVLPSTIEGLSDTLEFETLVNKVKDSWVGDKYMFIDAVYWGNQELMLKAVENLITSLEV